MTEQNTRLGIWLMIATTLVFALQDGISRHLAGEYNVFMVVMIRFWFFALFVTAMAARKAGGLRNAVRSHHPALQITRGVLLAAEVCVMVVAFVMLGLVESHAVFTSYPLLVAALSGPVLGEKVGWRRWTSTMIGFGGVLFMLQPSGDLWRVEALALLGAVVLMSVTRIWTRMLSVSDGPAAIAFWLMMAHIPMGLLFLPAFPPPSLLPSTDIMLLLVLFGVFNGMAHLMFARAFALAPVSVLAPFEYSPLLIGGVIGFLIWAEVPGWTTLAGASLVVAAGLYNVYREQVRRAQERSRMKDNA